MSADISDRGAPMSHDPIGPPRQPRSEPRECLPPDPSVPGLWWVNGYDGEWRVWRWSSIQQAWSTGFGIRSADWVTVAGWRVHSPAVPPGDAA